MHRQTRRAILHKIGRRVLIPAFGCAIPDDSAGRARSTSAPDFEGLPIQILVRMSGRFGKSRVAMENDHLRERSFGQLAAVTVFAGQAKRTPGNCVSLKVL